MQEIEAHAPNIGCNHRVGCVDTKIKFALQPLTILSFRVTLT